MQGLAADARSDIFSFGTVLFEMVTGRRAFRAETAPETLTAILKVDPFETAPIDVALSPGLERVLRHCLEKSPDERFQSARDLTFALEALSGVSVTRSRRTLAPGPGRRRGGLAALIGALILAAALGVWVGKAWWEREPPRFEQMTFRADSTVVDLSGRNLFFTEILSGGGRSFGTSIRRMDGSPAVHLGEGYGFALSPDSQWALAFTGSPVRPSGFAPRLQDRRDRRLRGGRFGSSFGWRGSFDRPRLALEALALQSPLYGEGVEWAAVGP